eukprot:TRINITY_DN10471_c0_g1_i1.p1 TRINITY_DN10471_c0_g1~~TRINITY_DN10471_c0_g1_i1.p1  ORF type:complete len:588 (+),score=128.30 TRINITY_DN10471_c0_g1_i1:101-1765(+)
MEPVLTRKTGTDLLNDPLRNKGTAWPFEERDRLGLRGLVPPAYSGIEEQKARVLKRLDIVQDPVDRYNTLAALQDRNETLFYNILIENIRTLAPIVYTPTVGEVCKNYSALYRRARGMYFSIRDMGQMNAMVYNWDSDEVDVIVVTDGSRVLGLGDLGAQGMGIAIGKLALYVAGGGIHPHRVLPITLDVGTNNEELLNYPLYLGLRQRRATGQAYYDFVDEFITAVTHRWPNVLIQFEDFANPHAHNLLEKYRYQHLVFNDDIQGTGAVATAGILAALKIKGVNINQLHKERIVIVGAGSAGLGVANSIAHTMMQEFGTEPPVAFNSFYMLDENGLIGRGKENISFTQRAFQRADLDNELSLLETIKRVKPTVILGLSGKGGLFTEEVIKEMYKNCPRPIIFPMSNPTHHSECTAEQAYEWTEGNCIFASGSPFDPITYNGKTFYPSQSNNMFIFPGLGLAASATKAKRISYRMLNQAAIALANSLTPEELANGSVFPSIDRIREVSLEVAVAVSKQALDLGLTRVPKPSNWEKFLTDHMWIPHYADVVHVRD